MITIPEPRHRRKAGFRRRSTTASKPGSNRRVSRN